VCACHSTEHQLILKPWVEDNGEHIVFVEVHLTKYSFWKRLVHGIKYIFGYKCKYGAWDEVLFDKHHVEQLEDLVNFLKDKSNAK